MQGRDELLLDVGEEQLAVHRAVDYQRGGDSVAAQAGDERRRLPMAVRNLGDQAFPARRAAALTRHLRTSASLVNEDQSLCGHSQLRQPPPQPTRRHVGPVLLRGVKHFF